LAIASVKKTEIMPANQGGSLYAGMAVKKLTKSFKSGSLCSGISGSLWPGMGGSL